MVDGFRLAAPQLFLEVASDETILKGVDGSLGQNIFCRIAKADPS
jgi:hypothetical protein